MSVLGRMADILQAKTHKLLNHLEDPNELLDLSYEKMMAGLQETKRHLADVVAEQKSLERQLEGVRQEAARAESDARMALAAGRDDLARAALSGKQGALAKLDTLTQAHGAIAAQADKLITYQKKLEDRIEQFRTQKEVMKSSYAAAQAQVKVTESLTGIGNNLGNVGDAMRRAGDKVSGMQAKADALEGLMQSGVLSDPLDASTATQKELNSLRSANAVDAELEKLKAEMASGKAKPSA
jgi:phage shock protein A